MPALTTYLVVATAAFAIGVAKGGLSGIGPVLTLFVSLAVPPKVAIGVLLPLLIVGDSFALWAHWRRWDTALVLRLLPGGLAGVAVASVGLRAVSERALELLIVAVTVLFVSYRLVEPRLSSGRIVVRPWHAGVAGVASGVTSTVAHVGGPPIAIYLLLARTPARVYVASSVLFFAAVNWLKVPGYVAAGLFDVGLLVRLSPTALLIPPGILFGRWIIERISQEWFDRLILLSLVGGGVLLLAR